MRSVITKIKKNATKEQASYSQILYVPLHRPLQSFTEKHLRLVSQQPHSLAHAGHAVRYVTWSVGTILRFYIVNITVMNAKIPAQHLRHLLQRHRITARYVVNLVQRGRIPDSGCKVICQYHIVDIGEVA